MEGQSFRYEMFARRLVAAEYGRPDAVQWANEWFADLEAERKSREDEQTAKWEASARELEEVRRLKSLGISSNPRFQAYLDTVEDPSTIHHNVGYFEFITTCVRLYGQQHRTDGSNRVSHNQAEFTDFVRAYADQHLSNRVRNRRAH